MIQNLKKVLASALSMALVFGSFGLIQNNTIASADSDVIAFPGAVGGGRYATGGRGGEVVHVTNLNDSGEGSFRDAVSKSNRIVVFDVSGTIELKSNILVKDNITIAGQTAPGGSGVTLKNYKLGMCGNNIICRYISSRPGPYASTSSGNDAWGGDKGSSSIIDHCSMSWTTDEQWGLYSNNEYYTVQYSIIGPADSWGGHKKGIHGFGLMMGKGYSTFDHNLIVHNVSRNFRGKVVGTSTADFTNNVIYNWGYQTAYGTIGHLNYVNNTLKMGPDTTGGRHYISVDSSTSPENFSIFATGNRMLNVDNSLYGNLTEDNWEGISVKNGLGITKEGIKSDVSFQTIVNGVDVSTAMTCESAESSYNHVIEFAGNGISSDLRTDIDKQVSNETLTGTGTISGSASYDSATDDEKTKIDNYGIECGVTYVYPDAVLTKDIIDSDNDGMPDDWEIARGLNPNDSSDTNGDYCNQGYTNIEYYINDLTINSFPKGVVTLSPTINDNPQPIETTTPTTTETSETSVDTEPSTTTTNADLKDAEITNYGLYMIKNVETGLYLEVQDGSAQSGANVQQWGANGSSKHNTWKIVSANNGYYYLYSQLADGSTYFLDVLDGVSKDGTNIQIETENKTSSQLFEIKQNEDGSCVIFTKASKSNCCLQVVGNGSGANVEQKIYDGSKSQSWTLELVGIDEPSQTEVTTAPIDIQDDFTYIDLLLAKKIVLQVSNIDDISSIDTNSDNIIDVIDVCNIKKYLLK